MKIYTNCVDCDIKLNTNNRARDGVDYDPFAAFCKDCWAERKRISEEIGTEFKCNKCGCDLIQDEENLYRIYCPICNKTEKRLQLVE